MSKPQILILTAVQSEAKAVAKALRLVRSDDGWRGKNDSILLKMVGIRAIRLPIAERPNVPQCVILVGFAGALDPSLKVGDVVMDDCPDELRAGFPGRNGSIHTSDQIVGAPSAKAEMFRRTKALAVDMEAHAVRHWVMKLGARFISIRSISDSASDSLDPDILSFVDDLGRIRPKATLSSLVRRPRLIPQLVRLGAGTKRAGRELGKAVEWMVGAIQSEQN